MKIALLLMLGCRALAGADVAALVTATMESERALNAVPFGEVVYAAVGKRVVPLSTTNAAHRELLHRIGRAMDAVLARMNATNSAAQSKRRINEVSATFEAAMKDELNVIAGLQCDYPKTAGGSPQRSGYPDLRLVDERTGAVAYLDPKLYERGSRASSLRTFYYEPKRGTNKILDDAHHIIVAFEHDGRQGGAWRFLGWEIVDLSHVRVRLKAEFQAGNRDMYQPGAVIGSSRSNLDETLPGH